MKNPIIFACLLAATTTVHAQWSGTNPVWTNSQVGIKNNSPNATLHIGDGGGSLHYLTNGILVKFSQATSDRALMEFHSPDGANRTVFQTLSNATYLDLSNKQNLLLQSSGGKIGVNNNSPTANFHVKGTNYVMAPSGTEDCGRFEITSPYMGFYNVIHGIGQDNYPGASASFTGVFGEVAGTASTWGVHRGVVGTAKDGVWNHGGYFEATSVNNGNNWSAAVVGQSYQPAGAGFCWAGYFNGSVYSSGGYTTSDRQFKTNIQPLTNTIGKIMLLKPSTYTFKTDEVYRNMGLPQGNQLGLIAQDLEEVFPELVTEIAAQNKMDETGNITTVNPSFKAVNYTSLIPVLIAGMQEQQTVIQEQQKQIDELKSLVESMTVNANTHTQSVNLNDQNTIVLNQNVPNPFAESTVISYNIPGDFSRAQVIFSNINGEVMKVINISAKGEGRLNVFADDLTSGIYTYSLVVDGTTIDTKKMIKQ